MAREGPFEATQEARRRAEAAGLAGTAAALRGIASMIAALEREAADRAAGDGATTRAVAQRS